MPRDQTTGDP